jgi:hypothetical protein
LTPAVVASESVPVDVAVSSWSAFVPIGSASTVHVAPDGGTLALENGRSLALVDSRSGHLRARLGLDAGSNVALADDAAFVQHGGALTAYALDGRPLWRRYADALLAAGDRTAFVSGTRNVDDGGSTWVAHTLSAIDATTGHRRWTTNVSAHPELDVVDVLSGDEPVVSYVIGEPMREVVDAFDSATGREISNTCFDSSYLTTIDGIVLCWMSPLGGDGYRPPGIGAFAARGGRRFYDDHQFAPDPSRFTQVSGGFVVRNTVPDDTLAVDARFVYVGIGGVLFRYPRDADPASIVPLELDGLPTNGLVVAGRFVTEKNGVAYEVTHDDAEPTLLPLSPQGARIAALAAHAPYVTFRTAPRIWFATDVERADARRRFDLPCSAETVASAGKTIVFACRAGSGTTLVAYSLSRAASRDGELRNTASPYADATPLPEAEATAPGAVPLDIHVPAARTRNDLRPRVVSPAARSIVTTLDRAVAGTRDLHWLATGCLSEDDGFTCAVTLPAPAEGDHTIGVTIFDGPGGTGNVLARGAQQVAVNGGPQAFALGLRGVPATLELTAGGTLRRGHAASLPIAVIARDADGYPILNTAPYDVPVAIALRGAPGRTTLSTNVVTDPNGRVILRYDGSAVDAIVLTAAAPNSAGTTLRIALTNE